MPATQMPSLGAQAADAATFYAGRDAHSVEGLHQQGAYYVAAWNIVHMFTHKGDYRGRFLDFIDALKRHEPAASAWARAFDEATSRRLASDYMEYFRAELDAGFVAIDVQTKERVAAVERVMRPKELQSLWARLRRVTAPRRLP